ncbi:MAG: hypothetical protein JOZ72_18430 [Alphaproteobacteria bacterium]|nr:hypothetical protein [Alphaproteobacteria bacterium]
MLLRLFPKQADNAYRGHWLGAALLAAVVLVKGLQGVVSVAMTAEIAQGADGIDVSQFNAAGLADLMLSIALIGFYIVAVNLIGAIVLIRWRALVPLMLLVELVVQVGARVVIAAHPIPRLGAPEHGFAGQPVGFYVNLALLALTVLGLILSLTGKRYRDAP